MAKRINEKDFDAEVLSVSIPVLVEFYSDGCLGCKQISPVLGDMEDIYEEQIKIVKVNAMFSTGLKENYHVTKYPTILFFQDGKEQERLEGIVSREVLEDTLKKYTK